jgi:DNA-binding beta-propeller fold protein YncE
MYWSLAVNRSLMARIACRAVAGVVAFLAFAGGASTAATQADQPGGKGAAGGGADASVEVRIPAERQLAARIVDHVEPAGEATLHMPTDVAVDQQGTVYIADGANHRVVVVPASGTMPQVLDKFADGGRLARPVGLTVDAQEQLWIADADQQAVLVVGPDQRLRERIALSVPKDDRAIDPTDIAVAADGRYVFVVDNEHHRVLVHDRETASTKAVGEYGRALGELQWPFQICVDERGEAYVTEAIGGRVQRLDTSPRFLSQVARWGLELGQLYRPKGIAVRGELLYVGDSTTQVVQVFRRTGRCLGVLTDEQGRALRFAHPMGLAFDTQGRLYVTELKANRVAVVQLEDERLASGGEATEAGAAEAGTATARVETGSSQGNQPGS